MALATVRHGSTARRASESAKRHHRAPEGLQLDTRALDVVAMSPAPSTSVHAMIARPIEIPAQDRGIAVLAHLSGLSGYVVPFGGILVPIALWIAKRDSPYIARIAQQAVLLNVAVFVALGVTFILLFTEAGTAPVRGLLPLYALVGFVLVAGAVVLMAAAVVLPIVGAVKASRGEYYRYPLVGRLPS
jgi:uncharacterized Tic20 family protein